MEGLDKLQRLVTFYKELPQNVLKSADTAMVNNSSELININISQLKNYGEDSEGKKLKYSYPRKSPTSGAYTTAYKRFKENKYGGQTSFVDLNLTGELLGSLRLDHKSIGTFEIYSESNADLLDILKRAYTQDIVGIQSKQMQNFATMNLKPSIENEVEQLINRI